MTYNRELKKFLGELIAKNATCIHVDFHFTKGDPNALEHTAKQKLKQYKAAFQYFEEKGNSEEATPTIREIYQMMSHMGRGGKLFEPKVITFGVSYAGVFSESALSFMHWLSTIKFPAVPGCWNYKMMRSHWVKTWCKIIQAGITNAVAPQMAHNYTLLVSDYYRQSQHSGLRLKEPTSITHLRNLPSYRNGDIIHTDEQAFGKEYINGGESEAKFDAFYAEGVGLSWRKDADEEAMHFVEDKSGALPQKRVGAEEDPTVHNVQLRDQRKMVKGMIPGATGSVVNMEEIEEGDEVRAFFRARGNKVKQVTGVVSEISQKGYVRLRTCGRWLKVVRKIASLEKCGGSKERTSKNKKINGISAKIGDTVTIMAGRSKRITGVVSAISKKGTVKLNQYGKWAKVMETNRDDATRDICERDSEKKLRSRTESSFKESQRTLPLNVSTEQRSNENSVEIGDKVKIKTARSELKVGIVSAVSKKGTVKLDNYGRFSAVVGIIKCNDGIGNIGERDSKKKPRSRTESSVKGYHSSLSTNNTCTSSRWERLRKRINTPRKKPHSKHYHYSSLNDDSIQKSGRTGDKVVAKSVPVNEKVLVTNGVDSSHLHCTGTLVERDIRIEDVLDLGEKFNDVLFVSRNTASLVERCTVNTTDILVLGERIHDSLVVCE